MLKEVLTIDNVGHSFNVVNDSIVVITTEGNCIIYQGVDSGSITNVKGEFSGLGIYSNKEFYLSEGFNSRIINIASLEAINVSFKIEFIRGDRIITSEKQERNRYLISRLRDGAIEWKVPLKRGKHMLLDQRILVISQYLDDGIVCGYDLNDGSLIWTYDVTTLDTWQDYDGREKPTQVAKVLGILEDSIYVYLNSGKILNLDIGSGEKISVIENYKNTDQGSFSGMFMNAIELDGGSGKLIQLFNQRYTEVDLSSNVVIQQYLDDFKKRGLENMSRFVFDSEHIYFSDKNSQTLGALNRSTKKLDWTIKLPQDGIANSKQPRYGKELKLKESRLFVLDNKSTLHIFKKEDHPA
jgi:hypothetical protein